MINKYAEGVLFSIGNETLEEVEEYTYLVHVVSAYPNNDKEIWREIGKGGRALGKHSQL